MKISDGAKKCGARENQTLMSYLVRMHNESRGGYYSDTVFGRRKSCVRGEGRACCIFNSPAPSEIEEGVSVIHPV